MILPDDLIKQIKSSGSIIITAGAGMGIDSGLPDFRGNEGFWRAYPPLGNMGLSFEEMANPEWFHKDPGFAWAFYGHRLNLYRETKPHAGFSILLSIQHEYGKKIFVVTSNVDGQFQKAGFDEMNIYEIHGSIHYLQCTNNCRDIIWPNKEHIEIDMKSFRVHEWPKCPYCSAPARPNILMFGDWKWNAYRSMEQRERYVEWLEKNTRSSTVIIEIGAGTAIPSIRQEGERVVSEIKNARLIRINPVECDISPSLGWSLECGGLEALTLLRSSL